ncbi:MAG: hypothetical protein ACJ757_16610 [Gaiellaceae bacterium]
MKTSPLVRLVIAFASIPVAYAVAVITHSQTAFVIVIASGVLVAVVLNRIDRKQRQAEDDEKDLAEYRQRLDRLTTPDDQSRRSD